MPDYRREFLDAFQAIAKHQHPYEVFRDFVIMAAISLHNGIAKDEGLEQEYLAIVARYSKEDVHRFPQLLGHLVQMLEVEPSDVLGSLYLELGLGNDNTGQFFTPPAVCELMAQMTYGDSIKNMTAPFITVSEPASGAGGMLLAFVRLMVQQGMNPAEKLWVQAIDVDRLPALMCYIQLSLWNVPGQVLVGNTLSMKMQESFYTPAHYMGGWSERLRQRYAVEQMKALVSGELVADAPATGGSPESKPEPATEAESTEPPAVTGDQFDFKF